MALVDNKITLYAKSIASLSDTPNADGLTAAQLKAFFDGRTDEEVKASINGIIDALMATTDGASGADQIKSTPLKVGGSDTVQGQLKELKAEKVDIVAGKGLSTNDYDNTEKANVASNAVARHTHTNKTTLDTYTQTEVNLADAVSKKHAHANNALLDTYTQTEVSLADAVTKKHTHTNKALLDTYAQTEADLAAAVANKHTHANKAVLDGIAEVTSVLGSAVNKVPSEKAVVDALSSSGYGDMLKAVYDTGNKATDIFGYADSKISKSLATAADQVMVSSGAGAWAVKTLAQIKAWLGLGTAAYTASTAYATATQGSTADSTASSLTTHLADIAYQVATGTATAITLTTATLTNGYTKTFIASANNNGTSTTINGKPLYKPNTTTAPNLVAGKAYTVWYNQSGNCFFIKASAEGTAVAGDVLASKTFSNDDDAGIVGTMPDRGAVSQIITLQDGVYVPPAGYHNGAGSVKAQFANLVASNVKSGIDIGGIIGDFAGNYATGTFSPSPANTFPAVNVGFRPKAVFFTVPDDSYTYVFAVIADYPLLKRGNPSYYWYGVGLTSNGLGSTLIVASAYNPTLTNSYMNETGWDSIMWNGNIGSGIVSFNYTAIG